MRGALAPGQQRPSFQPRKARSKGTPPHVVGALGTCDINVTQDALATHRDVAAHHADVISHLVRQKGLPAEREVLSAMFSLYLAFSLAPLFRCPPARPARHARRSGVRVSPLPASRCATHQPTNQNSSL